MAHVHNGNLPIRFPHVSYTSESFVLVMDEGFTNLHSGGDQKKTNNKFHGHLASTCLDVMLGKLLFDRQIDHHQLSRNITEDDNGI